MGLFEGLRATLPSDDVQNARNWGDTKETIDEQEVVTFDRAKAKGRPKRSSPGFGLPIVARWYMSRSGDGASPVYCSVWISTRDGRWLSGRGTAGGYGYCKKSAAFAEALSSAGVELTSMHTDSLGKRKRKATHIGGAGESAIRAAMDAVACAAGYSRLPRCIR